MMRRLSITFLFVGALIIPTVLGIVPLSLPTPNGVISLAPQEAEARARNTVNNRLRGLRVPTAGTNLAERFSPTRHSYRINLHQDRNRVAIEPRRGANQSVRHRIDTRRANGTWANGGWSRWRTGGAANNRINVNVNNGQERRVQVAVRDRSRNVRTYTVHIGRASSNTWASHLDANAGSLTRRFERGITNHTLNIPHNRASVSVSMRSEQNRATVSARTNNGAWSAASHTLRTHTVNVPAGGSATVQFRVRGAFSAAAPSRTHERIYTVRVNRAAAPGAVNPANTPTFTFNGTGWGHGVGMSQNGAMQRARDGHNRTQILQHYFSGVTIAQSTPANARMRVNLDQGRANRTNWRIGPRDGTSGSNITINGQNFSGANAPYNFTVSGNSIHMANRNGTRVATFGSSVRMTGTGDLLTVTDQSGPPLPSAPHRFVRYRGVLELTIVSGRLRLVNELPMQEYLYGVVPREIPSGANNIQAAIEAQAIAARSYAHGNTNNAQGVSSTVSFQVYGGHSRFANEANWRSGSSVTNLEHVNSTRAVNNTDRLVILSGGNVVRAYYSACNSDHTANSEDAWSSRVNHLRGVPDTRCGASGHAGHSWTVTMNGLQLANTLRQRGATVPAGAGTSVFVTGLTTNRVTGGWVRTLTVNWSDGSRTTIGNADNVRVRLGLRSGNFSVSTRAAGAPAAAMVPLSIAATDTVMDFDLLSLPLDERIGELRDGQLGEQSPLFIQQEMRNDPHEFCESDGGSQD